MSGDYTLESSVYILFTTRAFATGIPGTLSAATVAVYENVTATPIETSIAVTESLNSIAGLNAVTIAALAASGYQAGGHYHVVIEAGTVDSVSVVGEVVGQFTIAASAAAEDLANGTDGLGAIKAETALILTDTAEIGTAGAGLTNINLPNQTMDIVGDITGNLSGSIGSLGATAKTDVNAEVVDALNTDTYAEPAQGAPGATVSITTKLGFLYKAWRNQSNQTATLYQLYNDDAATVDHKATCSDNGTTGTKGEVITGP